VVLKSQAHVVGDIHRSLTIEKGAYFDGRAEQAHRSNGSQLATVGKTKPREVSREANTAAE
jgi:cytoskeletal protein CcmA (bactofilin family)